MFRSSLPASKSHGRTNSAWSAAKKKTVADQLIMAVASIEPLERRQLLSASPSFTPPQNFSIGEETAPNAMVVADVNGDGKPDIVTLNNYGDVSVLIGNGNGTFQKAQTLYAGVSNSSGGVDAQSLAVGSYGNKEYIFASSTDSDSVSVLSSNAAGVWSVYGTYNNHSNGSDINALTVANINGTPFLVTANHDGSVTYSQIEAGSGGEGFFGTQNTINAVITSGVNGATTSALVSLATGNFVSGGNGADLIVVGSTGHVAAVLAGTNTDGASSTSGGFEAPTKVSGDTTTLTGVTTAAAVYNGGSGAVLIKTTANTIISKYSNSSTAANPFGTGGTFTPGLGAGHVAVGDFNGDGNTDFMFVNGASGGSAALYTSDGNGSGGYNSGGTFRQGSNYAYSAAAGDFKGDGEASLAVGYYSSGSSSNGFVGVSDNSTALAPSITSDSSAEVTVGSVFSFTVTTNGVPAPKITETGGLPPGLKFKDNGDGTATISGKAGSTGDKTYALHLSAKNATDTGTQTLTLDISQKATFTSPTAVTFTEGTASTFKVKTTGGFTDGGFSPIVAFLTNGSTHDIVGGSSFDGLTLVDNGDGTATLSGTPTATGKVDIIVTSGSGALAVQQDIKLTLVAKPTFGANTGATFTVGVVDSTKPSDLDEEITTSGFPAANISISSGSLPSGLTFKNNGDGTADIFGVPAKGTGGVYKIKLVASNSAGPATNEPFTYTVAVIQAPVITSAASATFTVGKTGTKFTVSATGNSGAASTTAAGLPSFDSAVDTTNGIVAGSLPTGLTFTPHADGTATISGTPAAGTGGIYTLTIKTSTDNDGNDLSTTATQTFTLRVNEAPAFASASAGSTVLAGSAITPIVISTSAGFSSASITKDGGLPKGLTFTDNGNGTATISGTPAATSGGIYKFNVTAKNSGGTAKQKYTLQVDQAPEFTGSLTSKTVDATHGKAINRSAPLQGFDTPFGDLTNVGSGLTQNGMTVALNTAKNGLTLTGTPASAGTTTFQVTVDDADGDAGPTLTITVDVA